MTNPDAKNELFIIDKNNPESSEMISRDDFDFLYSRTTQFDQDLLAFQPKLKCIEVTKYTAPA